MKTRPGIFNDVIGPVMRGPSSSHTAASWRIAKVCLELLGEPLKKASIAFDENGAWAPNYREQGTTMGLNGGLLGLDITDDRMKDTEALALERHIEISYEISSFSTPHPNTLKISLESSSGKCLTFIAVSLGGGSIEVVKMDQFEVSIRGDYYEMMILRKGISSQFSDILSLFPEQCKTSETESNTNHLLGIKSPKNFEPELVNHIKSLPDVEKVYCTDPVLPIVSGNEKSFPYDNLDSLLDYGSLEKLDAGQLGIIYEQCCSGLTEKVLSEKMSDIINIIHNSIQTGLKGTNYKDRILPPQSHLIQQAQKQGKIPEQMLLNKIISYVSAVMESKSAMEVVVANPTAGSCGTVGGTLMAVSEEMGLSNDALIKAYFAAGLVGAYFADGPGFSAEEHGCQVECGAASGMAAAGIVQLYGGTVKQATDAASMAIQNMLGLICDPVADRVEVPCLGKNISAASNALTSATMACAGYDAVIPLKEVLQSVSLVSQHMPSCNKCTGKGGLAITDTSINIKENLKSQGSEE